MGCWVKIPRNLLPVEWPPVCWKHERGKSGEAALPRDSITSLHSHKKLPFLSLAIAPVETTGQQCGYLSTSLGWKEGRAGEGVKRCFRGDERSASWFRSRNKGEKEHAWEKGWEVRRKHNCRAGNRASAASTTPPSPRGPCGGHGRLGEGEAWSCLEAVTEQEGSWPLFESHLQQPEQSWSTDTFRAEWERRLSKRNTEEGLKFSKTKQTGENPPGLGKG